jgi:IS30 family transposase
LGPAYRPLKAHWQAQRRLKELHLKPSPLEKYPDLKAKITAQLQNQWSPELIAGRLKPEAGKTLVSYESIYRWIYSEARHLIPSLNRAHPKRWRRHSMSWVKRLKKQRISIHQRPDEINRRQVAGHWETDLVWGQGRAALQVLVERKTRLTRIARLPDKTARTSYLSLFEILSTLPPHLRQSLTYDNGVENFLYALLNKRLGTRAYFCDPYSAWQKGTVENTNGLIRRFLPRNTNFDTLPTQDIQRVQDWLNQRPRKCLNFKTPAEAFKSATVALAT